jgi:hypothetical protein
VIFATFMVSNDLRELRKISTIGDPVGCALRTIGQTVRGHTQRTAIQNFALFPSFVANGN